MRKIFIAIALLLTITGSVKAQDKISAILDKEPANNTTELNANAVATAALGEDGLTNMLGMLQPNGQADNTKIYDAVSGFSFYATQNGKEAWRAMAVKAYGKV